MASKRHQRQLAHIIKKSVPAYSRSMVPMLIVLLAPPDKCEHWLMRDKLNSKSLVDVFVGCVNRKKNGSTSVVLVVRSPLVVRAPLFSSSNRLYHQHNGGLNCRRLRYPGNPILLERHVLSPGGLLTGVSGRLFQGSGRSVLWARKHFLVESR